MAEFMNWAVVVSFGLKVLLAVLGGVHVIMMIPFIA